MQIQEKYHTEYSDSLKLLAAERERFVRELNKTGFLKVFPSQANFVMAEIINGMTSAELTAAMLEKNILIKDLSGKICDNMQQTSCLTGIYISHLQVITPRKMDLISGT